jgi:hypothetical protein
MAGDLQIQKKCKMTDQEERQRVVSNFEKYFPNVKIIVYNKDRIEVKVAINHTESDPA